MNWRNVEIAHYEALGIYPEYMPHESKSSGSNIAFKLLLFQTNYHILLLYSVEKKNKPTIISLLFTPCKATQIQVKITPAK